MLLQSEKFGSMQFTFKVKEQDLYSKGIGQYDLRLYQGSKEYPLQLLKYTYGYFYYVVTVPEMGKFVLGRVAPPEEPEPVAEVVPNVSAAEEEPAVPAVTVPEEEALIGKAVELPLRKKKVCGQGSLISLGICLGNKSVKIISLRK